jgi:agmatine deiminase
LFIFIVQIHGRIPTTRPFSFEQFYSSEEVQTLHSSAESENDAQAVDRQEGGRLAASYVNYYLANDAVILPQFGDSVYDKKAVDTMKEVFPDKNIVGVLSKEVLLGGGNIHCITQQVPKIA